MIKRLFVLLSLLYAVGAVAAPPTKESIDTLLDETHIARTFEGMMDNVGRVMQQQTAASFGDTMTPEQQRQMRDVQAKVADVLRQEMTFARLEPIYVEVYQQTFTQDEVDSLIAFYRTPAGRSYIDKMPDVLQRTVVAMQPMMKDMMQKVQAITKQAIEDAKAGETEPPPTPSK